MEQESLIGLEGVWQVAIGEEREYEMVLPGTLDENKIGGADTGKNQWHPDAELGNAEGNFTENAPIATRFTRKYTYEGEAVIHRRLDLALPQNKRIFLEVERARCLTLLVDGKRIADFIPPSLSTPHVFEVTAALQEAGEHEITFLADNSYPKLPKAGILYSSAATDETQTNWNGILGYVRLRIEEPVFVEAVRVYPKGNTLKIEADICADRKWSGEIVLRSEALEQPVVERVEITQEEAAAGRKTLVWEGLSMDRSVCSWDEGEGRLYRLTAELSAEPAECKSAKTVTFGVRSFGDNGNGRFALNGRTLFIRSETNCAEFPETGYIPMTVPEWEKILRLYQSYGVNLVRFHSHCPPEAAFTAADALGMLLQPELSHWNPKDAFETQEDYDYYRTELLQILKCLANHPSFVMLTLGNELHASEKGHERMKSLLEEARQSDNTRLYADGSNVHYGAIGCDEGSDFYASQKYYEEDLRGAYANREGYINQCYPDARHNYDETMSHLRKTYAKPVFSFEVGQFEVLPDFEELDDFQGISEPVNFRIIQERVRDRGLYEVWKQYVEATGELALLGYREECEAAMRTRELSGISLLGLQDFPGQGTALVGMLNSHLKPKPYAFARPERFRRFFTDTLPLVLLPKYTYENTEVLQAQVELANFGKTAISGCLEYELSIAGAEKRGKGEIGAEKSGGEASGAGKKSEEAADAEKRGVGAAKAEKRGYEEPIIRRGILQKEGGEAFLCPAGQLTSLLTLEIPLQAITKPTRMNLRVSIGEAANTYPIWVYPEVKPVCPEGVYEARHFDEQAKQALEEGKTVYLSPAAEKEVLPESIRTQFTTDFWSVGTFAGQEGGMGQLIKEKHPVFRSFPTEFHTNWQWWPMASARAVILPKPYESIITEMDSYAYLRPMTKLLECRCKKGKLLFSSMGLQDLQQYPEARALLDSIYHYLASAEFAPVQEIEEEVWERLVK